MIDSVLNLIFCCSHKRLTRPVTPIDKDGKPHGDTYVVCLACGKQFSYDLKEMRIGKPLPSSADFGVLPPGMPGLRKSKIKLALGIGVPLGIVIGSALSSRRKPASQQPDTERNKPAHRFRRSRGSARVRAPHEV
jgi:DNA-directed RNA polymerase subunit RPC12/RpoP